MATVTYRIPIQTVRLVRDGSVPADTRHLTTPESAVPVVRQVVPDDGREHFGVVLLNVRNRVIGAVEVSVGCLTSSLVHPREVFRPAIAGGAAAILLYHNHPSGDCTPSADDQSLTRRLAAGGQLIGIEVLDHIVLGDPSFHSFRQHGQI